MTEVRTFKASSMQEALDIVRQELGSEAVILHTRQSACRRWLPWLRTTQEVEITAGVGVNVRPSVTRSQTIATPAATRPCHSISSGTDTLVSEKTIPSTTPRQPTDSSSHHLSRASNRFDASIESTPTTEISTDNLMLPSAQETAATTRRCSSVSTGSGDSSRPIAAAELAERLDSIQSLVERLSRTSHLHRNDEIPPELFHLYTHLIDSDVEDDLARQLVFRVRQNATPEQLNDATSALSMLTAMVEAEIRCAPPITPRAGTRKVVALVGPTGVGKTTTIAKLAANFRLRDRVKMGLVTVDTYRIAAVEQLRTYAEIIDLPMKVVTSSLEMRRALQELAGLDLVLIDTAGRSPRDDLKIQELKSLLGEADVDEVHLVMSLTASARSLIATAEKFAPAGTTSLILTKLDETAEMGVLLSVAQKIPQPISYLTTGQNVPDDIEPANAGRIARLVLGQEKLFL